MIARSSAHLGSEDNRTDPSILMQGTANTLTRSEVRGGGKKPYAQKGTGNARIGSRRTPLRPGGGVSFGPKVCHTFTTCPSVVVQSQCGLHPGVDVVIAALVQATDWTIKINKKERRLAVATALQNAAADILVVDTMSVSPLLIL